MIRAEPFAEHPQYAASAETATPRTESGIVHPRNITQRSVARPSQGVREPLDCETPPAAFRASAGRSTTATVSVLTSVAGLRGPSHQGRINAQSTSPRSRRERSRRTSGVDAVLISRRGYPVGDVEVVECRCWGSTVTRSGNITRDRNGRCPGAAAIPAPVSGRSHRRSFYERAGTRRARLAPEPFLAKRPPCPRSGIQHPGPRL